MNVVVKKLSDLHEPEKNVRRHTDKQLAEYVRSIEMFGQIKPLVITEDGEILAGNGLYLALKQMGRETADCYVMAGLTPAQRKKVMLADNRVFELGITDTDIFDEIIKELDGDVDVPGWDADLLTMLNSSVTDATGMVEEYGAYDADAVSAINSRERVDHSQPLAPAAPAAPESAGPDAPVERFVICPKCGERICL